VADLHPTKTRLALLRGRPAPGGHRLRGLRRLRRLLLGRRGQGPQGHPPDGGTDPYRGLGREGVHRVGGQSFPTHSMRLTPGWRAVLERHPEFRPKEEQEQQR
jgi:hypothetical protein